MNKFRTLTRVLFKNGAMPGDAGDSRSRIALLVVAVAFLPLLGLEVYAFWSAYSLITSSGLMGAVLTGVLTSACVAMVLLGILYVISTYYFADDTLILLTMPIPSHRILAAKFTVVLLFQYFLEALIALPCLIVFCVRVGNPFFWVSSVLVLTALPLLPTVVCSVISILIMAFSRFFHNKDRVKFFAGLAAILLSFGLCVPMQFAGDHSFSLKNTSALMEKSGALFPSNLLAAHAILDGTAVSLLWLLAFLLLSAAAVALFLLLGNQLYLRGVVGLSQANGSGNKQNVSFVAKKRPAALAIALKDWRLLCRTPAYSLNCLLGAILVPVILVVTFGVTLHSVTIPKANPIAIAVGVLFLGFVAMTNVVSPTAISRDGPDANLMRLFPVRMETQIVGKLLPGLGLSFASLIITVISFCIIFRPDAVTAVSVTVLSAISLVATNTFGLFLDLAFPKLLWNDETVAVKQNVNVTVELLVQAVALGLPAFLIYKLQFTLQTGLLFLLIYNIVLLVAAAQLLFKKGPKLLSGSDLSGKPEKKAANRQKKIRVAASAVMVIAVLGFVGWEFIGVHTDVTINSSKVTISAGMGEGSSFDASQIQKVYLKDTMPSASKDVGFSAGGQMRGTFQVEGLGSGHVYTENKKGPFLFVVLKDGSFTIFNFNDAAKINNLYNDLKEYAPKAS